MKMRVLVELVHNGKTFKPGDVIEFKDDVVPSDMIPLMHKGHFKRMAKEESPPDT